MNKEEFYDKYREFELRRRRGCSDIELSEFYKQFTILSKTDQKTVLKYLDASVSLLRKIGDLSLEVDEISETGRPEKENNLQVRLKANIEFEPRIFIPTYGHAKELILNRDSSEKIKCEQIDLPNRLMKHDIVVINWHYGEEIYYNDGWDPAGKSYRNAEILFYRPPILIKNRDFLLYTNENNYKLLEYIESFKKHITKLVLDYIPNGEIYYGPPAYGTIHGLLFKGRRLLEKKNEEQVKKEKISKLKSLMGRRI